MVWRASKETIMGALSIWHILGIAIIALLLFGGGGKISSIMGDFGKGLKSFKDGMKDETSDKPETKKVEEEPKA